MIFGQGSWAADNNNLKMFGHELFSVGQISTSLHLRIIILCVQTDHLLGGAPPAHTQPLFLARLVLSSLALVAKSRIARYSRALCIRARYDYAKTGTQA